MMTRTSKPKAKTKKTTAIRSKTKAGQIISLLGRSGGASIAEMMKITGWQAHSIRGFLSGHLKKIGRRAQSSQDDTGTRRYRIEAVAS
jgi:hypothetical protein